MILVHSKHTYHLNERMMETWKVEVQTTFLKEEFIEIDIRFWMYFMWDKKICLDWLGFMAYQPLQVI